MKETTTKQTGRTKIMTNINARQRTRIGCWNVRTLLETSLIAQTNREMNNYNIKILGLSEIRWPGSGEHTLPNGDLLIFSGKPESEKRASGVGILISKDYKRGLIDWKPVSDRIITAKFRTRFRNVNITQCYAPTELAEADDKDEFYNILNSTLMNQRQSDINIVMGDLNAKVGKDNTGRESCMGKHGVGVINDNGGRLADFCTENKLVIGGTLFPHKDCHKITWVSPGGQHKNQIDHICISKKWRRSLEDVRNKRGADVGSDHHLVISHIKIKVASTSPNFKATSKKFNTQLLNNPNILTHFNNTIKRKHEHRTYNEDDTINTKWSAIKDIYTSTSESILGYKGKKKKEWISEETWKVIKDRKEAHLKFLSSKTTEAKSNAGQEYKRLHRLVKRSARNDKRVWTNKLAEKAQDAAENHNPRLLYSISKKLSQNKPNSSHPIKNENNELLSSVDAQIHRWESYFREILDGDVSPEVADDTDWPRVTPERFRIRAEPPSIREIKRAIMKTKNNKAPGPDNINAELWKANPDISAEILHALFLDIWEKECVPNDWQEGLIVKLFKKGSKTECNNYRGITLLNVASKVFALVILDRLQDALEPHIRNEQAGFRPNRSCIDQINTLRLILEQTAEWQSPLYLLFVDFEKAFDRVDRKVIWRILNINGIPPKLINIIKSMYSNSTCKVLHRGRTSNSIPVRSGVRQGCVLSPLLFLLTIDTIMRATNSSQRGIQWNITTRLEDLDYADDLCLLTHTFNNMQQKISDLSNYASKAGLRINIQKTKDMRINTNNHQNLMIDNTPIENTNRFCYLGSIVTKDGGANEDIGARIQKAKLAFASLNKFWSSSTINRKTKIRVFNSNVKSVLLYACETWLTTEKLSSTLQTFINKCLRRILGIRWPDTISNSDLWRITNQREVKHTIMERKWKWMGHILRRNQTNITRQALQWNPQGRRRAGRPKTTWRRIVEQEARSAGKTWGEIKNLAQNRTRWRCFVEALCSS